MDQKSHSTNPWKAVGALPVGARISSAFSWEFFFLVILTVSDVIHTLLLPLKKTNLNQKRAHEDRLQPTIRVPEGP